MFRSQVAEALFKHKHQKSRRATSTFLVRSCGTWVEKEDLTGKKLKDFDGVNTPWDLNNVIEVMKESRR
jgi:molybdopterin-guanine dinucleotide biosynthesis protein A